MSTYTFQNAVDHVKYFIKSMPVGNIQMVVCDQVNSLMWAAYPWRWALLPLTPIPLVDGVQDYATVPADYMKLVRARITRTDCTPDAYTEILIMKWLPPELSERGWNDIQAVCMEPTISKFRLSSAADIQSPVTAQLDGEYQRNPTKVAALTQTILFPDVYFPVFVAGLMWQFYRFADDPRGGQPVANRQGAVQYTGAMGEFFDALTQMRESEDWGAGDTIFPSDPLGGTSYGNPGIFGV